MGPRPLPHAPLPFPAHRFQLRRRSQQQLPFRYRHPAATRRYYGAPKPSVTSRNGRYPLETGVYFYHPLQQNACSKPRDEIASAKRSELAPPSHIMGHNVAKAKANRETNGREDGERPVARREGLAWQGVGAARRYAAAAFPGDGRIPRLDLLRAVRKPSVALAGARVGAGAVVHRVEPGKRSSAYRMRPVRPQASQPSPPGRGALGGRRAHDRGHPADGAAGIRTPGGCRRGRGFGTRSGSRGRVRPRRGHRGVGLHGAGACSHHPSVERVLRRAAHAPGSRVLLQLVRAGHAAALPCHGAERACSYPVHRCVAAGERWAFRRQHEHGQAPAASVRPQRASAGRQHRPSARPHLRPTLELPPSGPCC